jgi:hypothetical protein
MSTFARFALVGILAAMLVGVASERAALAQIKINFGGSNQSSNQSNNDQNDENQNNRRNRNNKQSDDDSKAQQVQQFFQGQQGGQWGQGDNSQQFQQQFQNRRSNGQGQFQSSQKSSGQYSQSFQQNGLQFGNGQLGNWQSRNWQGSRNVKQWSQTYGSGTQPFSKKWYDNHPKAWHYDHNHWDDHVWVVATTDGVAAWLGWAQPRGTRVVYGYQPSGVSSQQIYDPTYFGEWYPLGVYSLVTGPYDSGTRMMQLSVDRHGNVAGSYYDMITDTSHNVSGRVYQKSQHVYWTLSSNQNLKFRSSLGELTQPQGTVVAKLPGGDQVWQLVRLEN